MRILTCSRVCIALNWGPWRGGSTYSAVYSFGPTGQWQTKASGWARNISPRLGYSCTQRTLRQQRQFARVALKLATETVNAFFFFCKHVKLCKYFSRFIQVLSLVVSLYNRLIKYTVSDTDAHRHAYTRACTSALISDSYRFSFVW